MARCHKIQAMLAAYVEAELSTDEARLLEAHLATCSACVREAEAYRQSLALFQTRCVAPVPEDLYAGFAAKLAAQERWACARPLRWGWAGALGVLLMVMAGLLYGGFGGGHDGDARKQVAVSPGESRPPVSAPDISVTTEEEKRRRGEEKALPAHARGLPPGERFTPITEGAEPSRSKRRQLVQAPPEAHPESLRSASSPRRSRPMRQQVARVKRADTRHWRESVSEPREAMIVVPALNDSVQIGDTITRVRSASGWDANGRLALIRVDAATVPVGW